MTEPNTATEKPRPTPRPGVPALLDMIQRLQGQAGGSAGALSAEGQAFLRRIFTIAIDEGETGSRARAALRQILDGIRELAELGKQQ